MSVAPAVCVEDVVPALHLLPYEPDDELFVPRHTGRLDLPDPRPWAHRFAQAVVEVLSGDRPHAQLSRWVSVTVQRAVEAAVDGLVEVTGAPGLRRPGTGRAGRPQVRSVHVSEPADGVAEVCATVRHGRRVRALAFRLEGVDGRWCCTALRTG